MLYYLSVIIRIRPSILLSHHYSQNERNGPFIYPIPRSSMRIVPILSMWFFILEAELIQLN